MAEKLTEQETRSRYITPALVNAGWDLHSQVREEMRITDGRIVVRGKMHSRRAPKIADYVLFHKPNIPLAIVEAKDAQHPVGAGLQQALQYAQMFDVPFAASSNGKGFIFHDSTTGPGERVEHELPLDAFPSPEELWTKLSDHKNLTAEQRAVLAEDYYLQSGTHKLARYYQAVAVNRVVEATARGQKRQLLVMATGTGKTYTAFQIIWRLREAGLAKRVLFLVDRNVLADQAIVNDFQPFGDVMTKVSSGQIDKSYEVYLALYQAITDVQPELSPYREFSPDFFDLVVVDECHRGSAAADSSWRQILEYFEGATHIGLTATPKETKDVSNIDYFGEPVYLYSLREGIDDGFLAPYSVIRVDTDKDVLGWRPNPGQTDAHGQVIEDRVFDRDDFDRDLVLTRRTELVAERISDYLRSTDRYAKTIVFCEDIDHAERMRSALVNANADLTAAEPRYVVRITGDNPAGRAELDGFIDPESELPVIATTSKLLTTGVDVQTCQVIVLDQMIGSLGEFKQIVGRGTRVREDYGKVAFTIIDFRKATEHFADPEFDGEPISIVEDVDESDTPPDNDAADGPDGWDEPAVDEDEDGAERVRYVVNDVPVWIIGERIKYYGKDGQLITESLRDYTRRSIHDKYGSLDNFVKRWTDADRKAAVVQELRAHGVFFDALAAEVGKDLDAFDLICHVAFDRPPLTRRERADQVREGDYFAKYGETARQVLEDLLDKYSDEGVESIEDITVLNVQPLSDLGTAYELIEAFGGREGFDEAVSDLEATIYAA